MACDALHVEARRHLGISVNNLWTAIEGYSAFLADEAPDSAEAAEDRGEIERARGMLAAALERGLRERGCTPAEAAVLGGPDARAGTALAREILAALREDGIFTDARIRQARRSLAGLALGDAFGEQCFAFRGPELVARAVVRLVPDATPWRWTDDTAMGIEIVEVLAEHGRIDQDCLARRFAARHAAEPFRGYGGGAHRLLDAIAAGGDWRTLAPSILPGGSFGNGGAMRAAPLGAYFSHDLERAAAEAAASAEVTHAHPDGIDGAVAVALAAALTVRGEKVLLAGVAEHLRPGPVREGILRAIELGPGEPTAAATLLGAGERVSAADTVPYALWCAEHYRADYETALWATVSGGGDRDTTCAIVGGIVAASPHIELPEAWTARREPLPEGAAG